MNEVLVELVVDYILLLEQLDESAMPLESVVRRQEDIAFRLQQLSGADRQEFIRSLTKIANERPPSEREAILKVPEETGIE